VGRPRKDGFAAGAVFHQNGKWYARITLEVGERRAFELPTVSDEKRARERAAVLAEMAGILRRAERLDLAPKILARAASANEKDLGPAREVVRGILNGNLVRELDREGMMFKQLGALWTSGELARRYPDHVKVKRSADDDLSRLERHVYPTAGDVLLSAFTIEHAEHVMAAMPATLSRSTRRHVAQLMHRVLGLAVYPMRIIAANPLPRGWLPSSGTSKAMTFLYPEEDAALMRCTDIPLAHRVFYGVLAREGLRKSEALALTWGNVDLVRGALILDRNKTDDPRTWALDAGVAQALRAWHELGDKPDDERVFVDLGDVNVDTLRGHLRAAGLDRAQLFERSETRQPIRLHDLRATFVTLSLATGRSEAWVADRTGHRSSVMINRYRRAARSVAELGLGALGSLAQLVPELRKNCHKTAIRVARRPGARRLKRTRSFISRSGGIGRRGGFKIRCP